MRRREFITGVGASAVLGARGAWGQSAKPVIGFLRNTTAASATLLVSAFLDGLREAGYVEGRDVSVEYRWADNGDEKLPALAADLVQRKVDVIVAAGGTAVALAAKAATQTIPVVFELGGDPVKLGLVSSLNRPDGNVTGIALFANVVGPKRLEMLRSLVPKAHTVGFLVNSTNSNAELETAQAQQAATSLGETLHVLSARTESEIDVTFQKLQHLNVDGLVVTANPLFVARRDQLVEASARLRLPTVYPFRDFAVSGGLASYGDNLSDAFRQVGNYTARILKGEKPSDLPVMQPTKFELVINMKTAKALGLEIAPTLLAIADEVLE